MAVDPSAVSGWSMEISRGSWVGSFGRPTARLFDAQVKCMQRPAQVSVIILLGSSFVVSLIFLLDPSDGCPWGPIKLFFGYGLLCRPGAVE